MPTSSKTEEKSAKKISDARQQSLTTQKIKSIQSNSAQIVQSKSDINIIAQLADQKQKQKRGKAKHNKHLTINSRTQTLALKFYPEQLLNEKARKAITNPTTGRIDYSMWKNGDLLEMCKEHMRKIVKDFATAYNRITHSKKKHHWQVECIMHDRDEVANPDDMFEPSAIKPHFHLILRDANKNRFLVKTVLTALQLNYQKEDSELFYNQGCTTVADFNAYSMYLTHETEKAIQDGKSWYDLSEVMTNMTLEELKDVRAGYNRLQAKSKLSDEDWNKLADYVAQLGNKMKDFQAWADGTLTFAQQASAKFVKLHDLYTRHLMAAVESAPEIVRCCVLISGRANDGKSYTSRHALRDLGEVVYHARQSTSKYDGLSYLTTAIVFDDRKMTDALTVSDNYATILHGRGTGNDKPWTGRYIVITTNLPPDEFFREQVGSDSQVEAIKSRFFVSALDYDNFGHGYLRVIDKDTVSRRGTKQEVAERNRLYARFADKFNELIKNYHPLSEKEAPQLPDKYFKNAPEQSWSMPKIGQLEQQVSGLRDENLRLQSVFADSIQMISRVYPNWICYTGFIDNRVSQYYDFLVDFLKSANPDSKVFREDAYDPSWTVSELLQKIDDASDDELANMFERDCKYIRLDK